MPRAATYRVPLPPQLVRPGRYSLRWDGKDNDGKPVKAGSYTICVEAAREHGGYDLQRHPLNANGTPQQITLPATSELGGAPRLTAGNAADVSFSFRAPGYTADVIVDRLAGSYTMVEVRNGFVAVLNDLHKGRDAGPVWHAVIDVSAGLLVLVSLTGLVILWFVYKRRTSGFILAIAGGLLCMLLYAVSVP